MSTLHNRTPFEAFYGHKPDLSHLREIGARAFVLHNVPHNGKIGPRSFECILIGYAGNSKAYCCYHRATHKVIESFHVRFIESEDELPRPLLPGVVISLPSPNNIPDIHHSPLPPCASPPPLHRSSRIRGVAANPVALQLDCADPSARCKDCFAADVGHVHCRGLVVGSRSRGQARRREEKAKVGHQRRGERERDEMGAERN